MSRYNQSRKATNSNEMYKEVFDKKGVSSIIQFRAKKLKQVDQKIKERIKSEKYIWKYGDSFWSLASRYYSDPKNWWVIAGFNNAPTESHINIGDVILIPLSVSEVLQVL